MQLPLNTFFSAAAFLILAYCAMYLVSCNLYNQTTLLDSLLRKKKTLASIVQPSTVILYQAFEL